MRNIILGQPTAQATRHCVCCLPKGTYCHRTEEVAVICGVDLEMLMSLKHLEYLHSTLLEMSHH